MRKCAEHCCALLSRIGQQKLLYGYGENNETATPRRCGGEAGETLAREQTAIPWARVGVVLRCAVGRGGSYISNKIMRTGK